MSAAGFLKRFALLFLCVTVSFAAACTDLGASVGAWRDGRSASDGGVIDKQDGGSGDGGSSAPQALVFTKPTYDIIPGDCHETGIHLSDSNGLPAVMSVPLTVVFASDAGPALGFGPACSSISSPGSVTIPPGADWTTVAIGRQPSSNAAIGISAVAASLIPALATVYATNGGCAIVAESCGGGFGNCCDSVRVDCSPGSASCCIRTGQYVSDLNECSFCCSELGCATDAGAPTCN